MEPRTLDDEWLTVQEVASWLRVSPETVHRWVRSGKMIGLRVPSNQGGDQAVVRVQRKAVLDFVLEYSTA